MLPEKRLAIFDIDGTLTDTASIHQAAFLEALHAFDFTRIDTDWNGYEHHTDSWIFQKIHEANHRGAPSEQDIGRFNDELEAIFTKTIHRRPVAQIAGAGSFVRMLEKLSWTIAFATGSFLGPARIKLSACNISANDFILTSASECVTREEIVTAAITQARAAQGGDAFGTIVSFGDGPWDDTTARNLGVHFVGIGSGPKAEHLRALGNKVFPDFRNAEEIIHHLGVLPPTDSAPPIKARSEVMERNR